MRALTTIAAVAIGVMLLSGCLPQQPTAPPPPEPTAAPIFASDEEALAAATAAYSAYLAMSDLIAADGGANPERLEPFVTADRLVEDVAQFVEFAGSGRHLTGMTLFDSVSLQRFDDQMVAVYLCIDVSAVRLLDSANEDITPVDRPDRIPLEVGFETATKSGRLPLAYSDVWQEGSFCDG